MELVFDIGSTEITVGLFAGPELRASWRLASTRHRTPDEVGLILRQLLREEAVDPRELERATYASVMPAIALIVAAASEQVLGVEAVAIDARVPLPVRIDVDEPLAVGADRLVNAIAAHQLYATDAIVVDMGTATTYDCVTGEGVFIGGAIAPGPRTAAERLSERTARLPRVALVEPERVIGRRTEACLQSGIFYGAIDSVDGMVHRIRAEWQRPAATVVATGGLSALLAPHCRSVEHIEPLLTLRGILAARHHLEGLPHPHHAGHDRAGTPSRNP